MHTIVTTNFKESAGADAMGYFAKRIFPGPIMNKMLVYMEDNQANGPDAAVEFLIEYEDVWTPWVSGVVSIAPATCSALLGEVVPIPT